MSQSNSKFVHSWPISAHITVSLLAFATSPLTNVKLAQVIFYSGIALAFLLLMLNNYEKQEFTRERLNYNIAFPLFCLNLGVVFAVLFYMHPFNKLAGMIIIVLGIFSLILIGEISKLPKEQIRIITLIVLSLSIALTSIGSSMIYSGNWMWHLM